METVNFYKTWIHENVCEPEEAASLILGHDPKLTLRRNEYINKAFVKDDKKIAHLASVLDGYRKGIYSFNIFGYVNLTLASNYQVESMLMSEICQFINNLLHDHKQKFLHYYPYIIRALNINVTNNDSEVRRISIAERQDKLEETALIILKKNPQLKKLELAQEVSNYLAKYEPEFLKKANGELLNFDSIIRSLHMRGLKKRIK